MRWLDVTSGESIQGLGSRREADAAGNILGLKAALRAWERMEPRDYDLQQALADLVAKACSKRATAVAPEHLSGIKALCRASDANVQLAFDLLYQRLKQPHSQVRLLALEICDELFSRSKHFRSLLSARLTHVLELTVGHRAENPLPPPAPAATALRARALEALEQWNAQFGAKYKQVALGYSYLKNTLRMPFPDLPARAAQQEAQRREAQARARQEAREAYERLQQEQPVQEREFRSFLEQMAECFSLLAAQLAHQTQQQQQQGQQAQQGGGADAADEQLEWEDVEAPAPAPAPAPAQLLPPHGDDDALPAYLPEAQAPGMPPVGGAISAPGTAVAATAGSGPDPAAQGQQASASDQSIAAAAAASATAAAAPGSEAVLETLAGLHRLVANQALPAVQGWIRVLTLVQVEGGAPASTSTQQQQRQQQPEQSQGQVQGGAKAERQRLLAAATQLQGDLLEAEQRYQQLQCQRQRQQEEREAAAAAQAVVTLEDLFGADSEGEEEQGAVERGRAGPTQQQQQQAELPASTQLPERPTSEQEQQQQQPSSQSAEQLNGDAAAAAGAAPSQARQQQQQQQQRRGREAPGQDGEPLHNPYERLRDPAAPKQRPTGPLGQPGSGSGEAGAAGSAAGGGGREVGRQGGAAGGRPRGAGAGSSLPESVKKALAAKAPLLPGGLYTHYWDSNSAPAYVSGHGLDVNNHWGPVDVHTELPPERIEELFMHAYTLPTHHQERQQQGAEASSRPAGAAPNGAKRLRVAGALSKLRARPGSSASGGAGAGSGSEASGSASAGGATAQRGSSGGGGGLLVGPLGGEEDPGAKRARRAAERAYNEAVLAGMAGDEQLARRLHQAELERLEAAQQQEEGEEGKEGGGKKGRKGEKPKPSVRERLERKLLRRGLGAAARDAAAAESERLKDKFGSNRWENR